MRAPGQSACVSVPAFSLEFDSEAEYSPQLVLDLPCPRPSPEDVLQSKEAEERVQQFVASLPSRTSEVVRRRYWEDQSQADIARSMGVSEAAISKRLKNVNLIGRVFLADLESVG